MKRTGFTIVEVVVVVCIIGILIALLIPAFIAARDAARKKQQQQYVEEVIEPHLIEGSHFKVFTYESEHGTFLIFDNWMYDQFHVLGPFPLQLEEESGR